MCCRPILPTLREEFSLLRWCIAMRARIVDPRHHRPPDVSPINVRSECLAKDDPSRFPFQANTGLRADPLIGRYRLSEVANGRLTPSSVGGLFRRRKAVEVGEERAHGRALYQTVMTMVNTNWCFTDW